MQPPTLRLVRPERIRRRLIVARIAPAPRPCAHGLHKGPLLRVEEFDAEGYELFAGSGVCGTCGDCISAEQLRRTA